MNPDAQLLDSFAKDGSEAAFAEFVRRHVDFVFSIARRKLGGNVHAAEDVCQGTFIAASRRAAALARHGALHGWLYVTTRNLAAEYVRSDRRRNLRETDSLEEMRVCGEAATDWRALWPALEEVLESLRATDREIVLMRFMSKRAFAEIGRVVGITEDAARMRLDRALAKLRSTLVRKGAPTTAAALALLMENAAIAAPEGLADRIGSQAPRVAKASSRVGRSVLAYVATGTAAAVVAGIAAHSLKPSKGLSPALQVRYAIPATAPAAVAAKPAPFPLRAAVALKSAGKAPEGQTSGPAAAAGDPAIKSRFATPEERAAQIARSVAFFNPLFRTLHLAPPQEDMLRQALATSFGRKDDIQDVAASMGLKTSDPDVRALLSETDADLAQTVRSQLGDSVLSALTDYTNTGALRELTTSLSNALADTPTPLSPDQADVLVQIMAANQTPGMQRPTPKTVDLASALAEAQLVLTPQQVIAFKTALHTWH